MDADDLKAKELTSLECAVLQEICRQIPHGDDLGQQLTTVTVTKRTNSGAGFFSELRADHSTPPVPFAERVIGNVSLWVDGLKIPLIVILFVEDGYADMLEGAAFEDTTAIDFTTAPYRVEKLDDWAPAGSP